MRTLFFVLLVLGWSHGAEHPLSHWTARGPLPTYQTLEHLAEGEGMLVALFGDPNGQGLVSDDGETFLLEDLGLPEGVIATQLVHRPGLWVALASGQLWTKVSWTDEWEVHAMPVPLEQLIWEGGSFWAWSAGAYSNDSPSGRQWVNAQLFRSADAQVWTESPISDQETFLTISQLIEKDGLYLIANGASNGTAGLWSSSDGENWSAVPSVPAGQTALAVGETGWVASGSSGRLSLSSDGLQWTSEQFPYVVYYLTSGQLGSGQPVYSSPRDLTWHDGQFYALAEGYGGAPILVSSASGVTWEVSSGLADDASSDFSRAKATHLTSANGQLYILGGNGNLWKGANWETEREQLLPQQAWNWTTIAASDDRLVIAGEGGHLLWSDDAVTFSPVQLPEPADVARVIHAPELNLFLAVGGTEAEAKCWLSSDGITWIATAPVHFSNSSLKGAVWDGQYFWACGQAGALARSSDGVAWTPISLGTAVDLTSVNYGGGTYLITASEGLIFYSTDGLSWDSVQLGPETVTYQNASFGNGLWLVPDSYQAHLTEDFEVWWKRDAQAVDSDILFAFGTFIACDQRYLSSSPDGSAWDIHYEGLFGADFPYPAQGGFKHGARFQDRVVFVGDGGLIGVSAAWRDFFAEWQAEQFSPAQLADEAISGPLADPDGDGWANAFEYRFDLNPLLREAVGEASLLHHWVDNVRFDWVGYTGLQGQYTFPWSLDRPGAICWVERFESERGWVRDGLEPDFPFSSQGLYRKSVRVKIEGSDSVLLRLRSEVVRP
ncbi:WD40/YVTN/BNR-like repeat-containing protein [Roseibacillus persicicus]|uniref:WD40/YVTN/BNR-like repeat-containing protein n=1 Tax=Roseibacillus persicicus TaxID=454148 RepID=UPI00280FD202|nr:hypothetical protein [Roseibacillus persicicus]MDQ8191371.1 hypothetical protein [Roseibacillus persicicus]